MVRSGIHAVFSRAVAVSLVAACAFGVTPARAAELPAPPAGLKAPAKPAQMPAFNLSTASGGAVRADDLRGKVVIARFWATW